MINPNDVLVVTTSTIEGIRIKKYVKPISAHVVAGTNFISDWMGSFSDFFGGRSNTYQKQLQSLYIEAIDRLKYAASEIGANCIVGLKIDMDEISGKGKSMFMLTAVGTAIILEDEVSDKNISTNANEKFEFIDIGQINKMRTKKEIIDKVSIGDLELNTDVWNEINNNQIHEIFPFLLQKLNYAIKRESFDPEVSQNFYSAFRIYVETLPEIHKKALLYQGIREQNDLVVAKLDAIIKNIQLYDFSLILELLKNESFQIQKRGLKLATYDKPYYNKEDLKELQFLRDYIVENFTERGVHRMKKQLLSSKEVEVWLCECGKTNSLHTHCTGCHQDIYGFKYSEMNPEVISKDLDLKINLISEYLN
ncbi:YbjQ family protein [Chryseobacterium sp. A321]